MISLASPSVKKLWPSAFLLLLIGLIAYAYAPSLKHLPRADQWAYTLDTLESDGSFTDIVAHTWSYSRTRKVGAGDTHLFRPLLFVVLAGEMACFGNHFAVWHLFGIALHVLVCVLLFSLLRRLRTLSTGTETAPSALDWLPYLLALFFAVNYTVADQVIWEHIVGYLVFTVLILAALRLLLEFSAEPATLRRPGLILATVWVLVVLASFTYELGQFCAIVIGLYLAGVHLLWRRPRRAFGLLAVFVAIVVIYQSANFLDRWYHRATYVDDMDVHKLLAGIPSTSTVKNLGRYLCFVLVQPFFPAHCPCYLLPLGKMLMEEYVWEHRLFWDAKAVFCLAIFGLGILLTLLGLTRLRRGGPLLFLLMTLAIVGAHAALIVCGRLNLRPDPKQLTMNPYYIYIPLLLLLVCAAVPLLSLDRLRPASTGLRKAVGSLLVGLVVLCIVNIDVTRRINVQGAELFRLSRDGNKAMLAFVKQHEGEADFRLAIIRSPNDYTAFASTIQILYHPYLDHDRPTWLVFAKEGRPTFVSVARWREEHPGEEPDLYPELVSVQREYYVLRADDRYYAVRHIQLNPFLAATDRSTCPLSRRSLPELLAFLAEQSRIEISSRKHHW